ncbi:MAG: hypothetical protein WDW38_002457 [Sanguina aurantia]
MFGKCLTSQLGRRAASLRTTAPRSLGRGFQMRAVSNSGVAQAQATGPVTELQGLYDYARQHVVGSDPRLSNEVVAELSRLMSLVPLEQLGFSSDAPQSPGKGYRQAVNPAGGQASSLTYLPVYEDMHMTMGIFCFPAGAIIPLHNHPGMTVLSRLLFGTLEVTGYDLVEPVPQSRQQSGNPFASMFKKPSLPQFVARQVVGVRVVAPAAPLVLFPNEAGNVHEFKAHTACAVLDLLCPPYNPSGGRDCTYYEVLRSRQQLAPGTTLLGELPIPE